MSWRDLNPLLMSLSRDMMIQKIERWIDRTNSAFAPQATSCAFFRARLNGFFSAEFLDAAFYVAVDDLPKPDFPELRQMGLGAFIDMPANGITYKNTYYVRKSLVRDMRLHFHELVHVVQWHLLPAQDFIRRYIAEIQQYGYEDAPLEKMAYTLDGHFSSNKGDLDVISFVREQL